MTDAMECRRAEELLSDHLETTLAEPLLSELETHLAACARCRALRGALTEVVGALGDHPVLEPPLGLAERAAAAALARPASGTSPAPSSGWRPRAVPWALQAAAATLAVAMTGTVLMATGTLGPARATGRLRERTVNACAYLAEKKDRLVEDFRILRVVIGTAFGSRLDRVNDRVDDYRRLLGRRKGPQGEPKKSNILGPELVTCQDV